MPRPDSVSEDDILRWSNSIDHDPFFNSSKKLDVDPKDPIFREVLYAGLWLVEQLLSIGCSKEHLARIQFTAGQLSYRHEPWLVHIALLDSYLRSELSTELNSIN